ncbi:MAG: rhomboid family intramembrane serine protease [Pseudomonadota bacterium]
MLPIRDHNPSERIPIVTYALMATNVVIFVSYVGLFQNERALYAFFADYALIPAAVSEGQRLGGFLTSMFLHGGWMHLLGNMLFLWIFGDNLEDEFGHFGFLIFYLATGVGAGFAHWFADPSSAIPTVGASGAIAGVMGGYLLLFPKARVDILFFFIIIIRIIPVPAWLMLGLWFGIQLFNGVGSDLSGGGVAYWAHAGGFVLGFLAAIPAWLARGGTAFWGRTHGHPPHPEAVYRRSPIPRVPRR